MLSSVDIYCAPNTGGESFGMILTEAMAAGAAVVASDLDAFRRVLDERPLRGAVPGRRPGRRWPPRWPSTLDGDGRPAARWWRGRRRRCGATTGRW